MLMEFFDYDPLSGITQYTEYDNLTDELVIHSVADAQPVLEMNKAMANDPDYKQQGIKNEFWHVASIPQIVQLKWLTEKGIDVHNSRHWPEVRKLLNDPEYLYLKTTPGRI